MIKNISRELSDKITDSFYWGLEASGWRRSMPTFSRHRDGRGGQHVNIQWTDIIPGTALPFLAGFRISTFTEYEFAISFDSAATADHKCAEFFPGNVLEWLGGGVLRISREQIDCLPLYEKLGARIGRLLASISTAKADWPFGNPYGATVPVRSISEFLSADETEGGENDAR